MQRRVAPRATRGKRLTLPLYNTRKASMYSFLQRIVLRSDAMATSAHTHVPQASPISPGDVLLDHYRVEEVQGALGAIWYARASYEFAPQLAYSIQVLPWSGEENCPHRQYFLAEAERLQGVSKPPFVPLVRHGILPNGHAIIVHEYLEGSGLYDLRNMEPFTTVRSMRVLECVARAMKLAHDMGRAMHGFTHFDILVDVDTSDSTSAAHILHAPHPIGSRCLDDVRVHGYLSRYHAPEFVADPVGSITADIYALGMLLSVLLLGDAHRSFVKDPLSYDFDALERFRVPILRALSHDPEERFASIDAMILASREAAHYVMRSEMHVPLPEGETRVFARRS